MEAVTVGGSQLRECPRCEGIWTDTESLRQICADREKQSAVLGMPNPLPADAGVNMEQHIRYLPCPICRALMNRVNFASFSNVIVDVCREHGTWFDRDELRRVVDFIRGGGLDKARAREMADLEEDRRLARADQPLAGHDISPLFSDDDRRHGVSALGGFLLDLLK
jgi:Zn-finger nucleic acid-binding protein